MAENGGVRYHPADDDGRGGYGFASAIAVLPATSRQAIRWQEGDSYTSLADLVLSVFLDRLFHVPEFDCPLEVRSGQNVPVWRERQVIDSVAVTAESGTSLSRHRIPEHNGSVAAAHCQQSSVGREFYTSDVRTTLFDCRSTFFPCRNVPQLYGFGRTPRRCQSFSIGRKRQRADAPVVTSRRTHFPGGQVPKRHNRLKIS